MIKDLKIAFEKYESENTTFSQISDPKPFRSADMCAFHLLSCLVPSTQDIISSAEHDVVYLSTDCNKLAKIATEDHILYLVRCGIWYNQKYNCLCLYI